MNTTARVRDVARGGDAVVETESGAAFVSGALEGEKVRIGPVSKQGRVHRAALLEVLEPSPHRREPACKLVDRCGGCPLMIAEPVEQRRIKQGFIDEALRSARVDRAPAITWIAGESELGYRRRARLAWRQGRLGYRRRRSHEVIDVPSCPVLIPVLQSAFDVVRTRLLPQLVGSGEVLLALGHGARGTIALRTEDAQPSLAYAACEHTSRETGVAGIALQVGEGSTVARWGDPTEAVEGADGGIIEGTVAGFSQANDEVNSRLVRAVVELAEPAKQRVLELYSGTGNLTVALAADASVTAIEHDESAAAACRRNLASRGLQASVLVGRAETPPRDRFDIAVLDPPRTGAEQAMRKLVEARPRRIVYVSCDTGTLGRDIRIAVDAGYLVDRVVALDMFPNTAQVETVVRLVCS